MYRPGGWRTCRNSPQPPEQIPGAWGEGGKVCLNCIPGILILAPFWVSISHIPATAASFFSSVVKGLGGGVATPHSTAAQYVPDRSPVRLALLPTASISCPFPFFLFSVCLPLLNSWVLFPILAPFFAYEACLQLPSRRAQVPCTRLPTRGRAL